mmetsp:Transcript_37601/g.72074  ORF Transcript_37601/g.72074 Transcript_37601/m.72074 type:complete len:270 (-) Transcript_37601:2823-3632(-)
MDTTCSRQNSPVSSSSLELVAADPEAQMSARMRCSRLSASRNLLSEKSSSTRHASTQLAVRSSASSSSGLRKGAAPPPSAARALYSDVSNDSSWDTWLDRPRKSEDVEDERFSRGLAGRIAARSAFSASVMMPPSGLVTFDGSRPSLCMRRTQSTRFCQPPRMWSPYLLAMANTVTAAMRALWSSPNAAAAAATLPRAEPAPPGDSRVVNLHSAATRLSITSSCEYAAASLATEVKPSSTSFSTCSSSVCSNTTDMAAMQGPQMRAKRS